MAKFRYRMQNILDIKAKLEEQAKITYGIAQQKYMAEQEKLQEMVVRRAGYERKLKKLMDGPMDLHEIQITRQAAESMRILVRRQMVEVHKKELELEAARKALTEVMQERKMHEKLKEKAYEEFLAEQDHEERLAVDQLVSYNYNSK